MPIEMKYIDNGVGVLYIGKGKLSAEEIIKADQKQLINIENLKKKKWFLGDFSEVDEIEMSNKEIEQIARIGKEMALTAGTNIVAIVASKDLMFGLSRVWEIFVEIEKVDWHTKVFRTRVEAELWLKNEAKTLFNIDLTIDWEMIRGHPLKDSSSKKTPLL